MMHPDYKPYDVEESIALTERRREHLNKRPIDWDEAEALGKEEEILQMRFSTDWWRKLYLERLEKRRLLYVHGAISMPAYLSPMHDSEYTSAVPTDGDLVFVQISHDRGGYEHWFFPYNPSFRVRHEGRGFASPYGRAISTAFNRVYEGIAAYTFMIAQIQAPGHVPLDYLCLLTHETEVVYHGVHRYSSTHTIVEAR